MNRKRCVYGIALIALVMILCQACRKTDTKDVVKNANGMGSGKVDFTSDEPKIILSDIEAYVGTNIDFLGNVSIVDEDKLGGFQVCVNATEVDITEPGTYTATYIFSYAGKEYRKEVKVTIVEAKKDDSNNKVTQGANNTQSNTQGSTQGNVQGNTQDNTQGNNSTQGSNPQGDNSTLGDNPQGGNSESGSNPQGGNNEPGNSSTQAPTTNKYVSGTEDQNNSEPIDIKPMDIELLSGGTYSLKMTTAKYVVSTRTDESYETSNGVRYIVTKLIITYNSGIEQIIETSKTKA